MGQTFYFYDLETSGFSPRQARIMQFAGQRTDLQLNPIGEPHNVLIKMTEDILPDPSAILVTGITPQQTIADGMSEAEFLKLFTGDIATPDTIFVGYNSVRFDDEFMRYLQYRNFYDPYQWQWQDGRSRWDLLDVIRMMRALRPEGIKWPVDSEGKPTNRLEYLTSLNGIDHGNAHDALSDVRALIAVAQLIYTHQSKLFDFLLQMRDKKAVEKLVMSGQPFMYSSGKYSSEWEKTTAAVFLAKHPKRGALVYDLRSDPGPFLQLSPEELAKTWLRRWNEPGLHLPVKTLAFNRCPAVAPLVVLDKTSQKRLKLFPKTIEQHLHALHSSNLAGQLLKALELMEQQRQTQLVRDESDVDSQLYDGFFTDQDQTRMAELRKSNLNAMQHFADTFTDARLNNLLPLYLARNFPASLTNDQRQIWDTFRRRKLLNGKNDSRAAHYFSQIEQLIKQAQITDQQRYLLEELRLYGESILPDTEDN